MRRFLTCFLPALVLSSSYAFADAGQLNERLARFSLQTGEPSDALRWVSGDSSLSSKVVRGLAYWDLGLIQKASEMLQAARDDGLALDPEAILILAKAQKALGKRESSEQLLENLRRKQDSEASAEAGFLLAEQAIEDAAYDRAGRVLANSPEGYWTALGYLNLATAYARQDSDTARSLIALRVAQAMLGESATTAYPELLQRIQLTAAFLALKGEEPDKALSFLDKVALNGYHTPQALYLHGLAHARKDNYRAAMQSWHRARKFPLGFPGTADAWLGMGRGFDESGYLGQSGEAYLGAIAAFEGELVTLDTLKQQVQQQGGYESMVLSARSEDVEWFLADSKTLTQPRLAYLMHFMEDTEAQEAVARVAGLHRMAQDLRNRRHDLEVFQRMLTERSEYLRRYNGTDMDQIGTRIAALRDRQQRLKDTLQTMAQSDRSTDMASGELAAKLEQVRSLEAKKNLTPGEVERLNRLKGVLTWEAQEQFDLARREHERELARIDTALSAAEKSYGRFEQQLNDAPERYAGLSERTEQLAVQVDLQLGRIFALRQRAEEKLDQALLDFLDGQTAVISAQLDRSEQQLAHLYEYLALNQAKESTFGGGQ